MSDDTAAVATPEAPTEPVAETTSLADHAALYGPADPTLEGEAKVQNEEARAKVRHRAQSQQAGPEDVGRIAQLTKRLRDAEAERDALKAQPAPSSPVRADHPVPPTHTGDVGSARQAAAPSPTRERPSADEIGTKYDTYEAYVEDLADWKYEQRDAARQAKEQEAQQARQQAEHQQSWHKAHQTYTERLVTFKAQHADFDGLLEAHGAVNIPAAPYRAILDAETGPAWVYHLMSHPDQLAELALLFDGKAPTPEMVAHATRWLTSRAKVEAPTPAPVIALAPRPPTPVRTGAARADDTPGEDMSIEQHEKQFLKRRR